MKAVLGTKGNDEHGYGKYEDHRSVYTTYIDA